MEKNEVKKALYKQNPTATLDHIRLGVAYYKTIVDIGDYEHKISFEIPINDMGEAKFEAEMEAKFLIRWIV